MKKIITLLTFVFLTSVAALAQDSKSIYSKFSDEADVSAVYISPAMFRMIGKIPSLNMGDGDVDITPMVKSLKSFYLLSSSNPKVNERLGDDVKKYISSGKYELMMEAKDSGEVVRMYTVGNEKTISSFVMMAMDRGETTFISLDGAIDREDLEKLIAKALD